MPSVIAKKKGNKLYYYVVESARVEGQPRIVHQAYSFVSIMTDKTVSHAIERGIYFLFANRRFCGNEPRGRQPLDCGRAQVAH